MEKLKPYNNYINEDYSIKDAVNKGKEKIKGVKNWIASFVTKAEDKPRIIPKGIKKGKPVINVYHYTGPGSIVSQLNKDYPEGSEAVEESEETPLDEANKIKIADGEKEYFDEDPGYKERLRADPETHIPNIYGDNLISLIRDEYEKLIEGYTPPPLFIYGGPGIGKTKIVGQVCDEIGGTLIDVGVQYMQPEDFVGVPSKVELDMDDPKYADDKVDPKVGKGVTRFNQPLLFPTDPLSKGIIFFDEMNRADTVVLSSLLTFARERRLGDYYLPDGWMIVAAGNRKEDVKKGTSIKELGSAFGDRWTIVNYVPTVESFVKHVETYQGKALPGNERTEKLKDVVLPELLQFLKFQDKWFYTLNKESPDTKYASPRDWISASTEIYASLNKLRKNGGSDFISLGKLQTILKQHVGLEAANAFTQFYKLTKEMNPADIDKILTDGDKAPIPKKTSEGRYQPDIIYAIITAVLTKLESNKEIDISNFENILKWSMKLESQEWATTLVNSVTKMFPGIRGDKDFAKNEVVRQYHSKYIKPIWG